jgi:hypothetical protein
MKTKTPQHNEGMKTKTPQNNVRIMKKHHNTMTKTPQHNV